MQIIYISVIFKLWLDGKFCNYFWDIQPKHLGDGASGFGLCAFVLTPYQTKKKFSGTSCIHNSQHDWWYPRYLAIWCAKDLLYLFEEHCDGFRECIGKSNGDESSKDHDPTPSSIRGSILQCCCWRWHFFFSCNYAVGRNKMLILCFK